MSDTPETDAMEYIDSMCDKEKFVESQFARKLERERNFWKDGHDNQVKLKQIISDRPDMKERAKLVEKLIKERDEWKDKHDAILKDRNIGIRKAAELLKELKGWKEAAYSLGEALPASWDKLQPPAAQLAKFKEMVALQNEKDEKY